MSTESITVADVIAALETYPADAEIYLGGADGEPATMHIHVEYDCYRVWEGDEMPEPYRPVITVEEAWLEEL